MSAPRDVRVELTRQEAQLVRHRCEREIHLVKVQLARESRTQTESERSDLRRYRRIIEQVDVALIEAGHE